MLWRMVRDPRCGFICDSPACLCLRHGSLFRGCVTICASCSDVPVAEENVPFSNTPAMQRISHVTCLAQHCKCSQLLPPSLLIAVIPGFIVGCSGQLKSRRKGLDWEPRAWM